PNAFSFAVGPIASMAFLGFGTPRISVGGYADLWWRTGRSLSPGVRLGALQSLGNEVALGQGTVALSFFEVFLDGCPYLFQSGAFGISPCVRVVGGVATASPSNVDNPRTSSEPWIAIGALLRGSLFSDRFARPIEGVSGSAPTVGLDVSAGVGAPIRRDRFILSSGLELYRAPAITGHFELSLAVRW
ncbi:MAG: hypothetical protein KBF88_05830, partial [Polyangiaceae bacterium]|nr:hypothetical protein [Polyangiaceae bacterium]